MVDSRRIEICGGVASGKTTLCRLLENGGLRATYENFKQNPFWSLFYTNPKIYAFETEVTFLLQHYCEIKTASVDAGNMACDFALLQDRAYAEINLAAGRLDAFLAVYKQVLDELPAPSLIVHLVCSAEEELARIRRRARREESAVETGYLDSLNRSIARYVEATRQTVQVLEIDSQKNDFASDQATCKRVTEMVLGAMPKK